ncbi:GNAT family N-acetyltransferase [Aeromicrobium sp. UC242_57]|uniref:GNAT family N-acetyltransferase n=1 Tax=Aeromicrobium sp. UC242_57 TaxID=3374624 RepID=UPI0037A9A4D6
MRADLERLGRFDPVRVRQRFLTGYSPGATSIIEVDGDAVGCIAVREEPDSIWIEHFYLAPRVQNRGLGRQVLEDVLVGLDATLPVRINVLVGSPARRLYERHGFVLDSQDEVDVYLVRNQMSGSSGTSPRTHAM